MEKIECPNGRFQKWKIHLALVLKRIYFRFRRFTPYINWDWLCSASLPPLTVPIGCNRRRSVSQARRWLLVRFTRHWLIIFTTVHNQGQNYDGKNFVNDDFWVKWLRKRLTNVSSYPSPRKSTAWSFVERDLFLFFFPPSRIRKIE